MDAGLWSAVIWMQQQFAGAPTLEFCHLSRDANSVARLFEISVRAQCPNLLLQFSVELRAHSGGRVLVQRSSLVRWIRGTYYVHASTLVQWATPLFIKQAIVSRRFHGTNVNVHYQNSASFFFLYVLWYSKTWRAQEFIQLCDERGKRTNPSKVLSGETWGLEIQIGILFAKYKTIHVCWWTRLHFSIQSWS